MTDKEIIIDGIDMSGCKHYKNRNCIADYCLTDMPFSEAKCELNPNCYYKQLKRKEQEFEKYKQALAEIKEICSEMNCESLMQNSWCGNTDFKMGCCEKLFKKQILQEINEVENAR